METTSFLIFRLRDSRYAVKALDVREIVPLPEIIALDETPGYVAGVISLRGQIVPVIDLNMRFGHAAHRCRLEDCVVVLEQAGSAVGMVVNEVQNVLAIAPNQIEPLPSYRAEAQPASQFLTGLIKSGEHVVMLLQLENLLRVSQSLMEGRGSEELMPSRGAESYCADATPEERAVFRARAHSFAQPQENLDQSGLLSLAVVRLGGELFGIELQTIREFAELRSVTPVPCCPEHVVGQMNLRGDLITLVDIARALGLQPSRGRDGCKVVVVHSPELSAGVLVDEVLEVLTLRVADVSAMRDTAHARGNEYQDNQEYLLGTAPHESRMLSLLDLPALLRQARLQVNEKP